MRKLRVIIAALLLFVNLHWAHAQVPWLEVSGNQIVDEGGNPVTLRGVSILAPEHNNECTTCSSKPISEMLEWQMDASRGWHSRVVRLQVTTAKVNDPAKSFATIIDPYVQQAIAKGIYIIVDLHFVSDFDYNGSGGVAQSRVMEFWNYVAPRYADVPNVIFEVFNEPISPDCWSCWKEYIQPVVSSIRSVAPRNLILMGNPQWSTRVNAALSDPIAGNDIVYVYHLYPNQGPATASNLDPKFGTAAQTIPVMVTEFGWNQDPNYSDPVTQGSTTTWGAPFRQYLDARPHISWTSFIFDNFWKPQFFDGSWNLLGSGNQGQFMQQWFLEMKDHNQPQPATLTAAAANAGQINLSWPAVSGAQSYHIKRASVSGGPYTLVASGVTATTFSDIGLSAGTSYYYVVSPVIDGVEGPNSQEASAVTELPGFAPDVPLYLDATGSDSQVALTWRAAPGAASYNVKRGSQPGGPYNVIASGVTATNFVDTDVVNGTLYHYVVSAVSAEESAVSAEASDIPSSVVVITDNDGAVLTGTWTESASTPGFYGASYLHDGNTGGTTAKSARYTPSLPGTGNYQVSVRWASASNRASNTLIDVTHAGGTATYELDQRVNGGLWVPLGVLAFDAGTTGNVVVRNEGADGYVIADAIKFALTTAPVSNTPPTAAFTYSADGLAVTFDASTSVDNDGTIIGYAWDFGDGTTATGPTPTHTYAASGSYHVVLTVTDDDGATDDEQESVSISDGSGGNVTTVVVNQQANGGVMNILGTFNFDAGPSGSVTIRTDGTNGFVVADAVKFSRAGETDIILDNASASGVAIEGAWSVSSATPGYVGTNYLHDANSGKGTKRVTYTPTFPVAGDWIISVQWTSDPNRATNVPIDITHSGTIPVTTMHVDNIIAGSASAPKGTKNGTARVFIKDNSGIAVANATVSGTFSGDFNESRSGVTGPDGSVTLTTTATKKGTLTFDFCVDNVTHATIAYDANQNVTTCTGTTAASTTFRTTQADDFHLYPNPADQSFHIDLSSYDERFVHVAIKDPIGSMMKQATVKGGGHYGVSTQHWRDGLYVVTVSDGQSIVIKKILLK